MNKPPAFSEKVFTAVRGIPEGKVASYSQVAILAGSPRAARAVGNVLHTNISPENLAPDSKNPIIAAFFRNIGLSDELGSGMRKLHYYVPRYSGSSRVQTMRRR
jgi:hypothetical protein